MGTEEKIERFLQLFNHICEGIEALSEIESDFSEKVVDQIPNTSAILKYNAITLSIVRTQVEKSIAETLKEIAILVKGDE